MLKKAKRLLEITFGVIMIAIGVTGFLFPFLPGLPPFIFGVILISPSHGKRLLDFLKLQLDKIRLFLKKTFKRTTSDK